MADNSGSQATESTPATDTTAANNYTEFEIRSSRKDSRRYYCGRFPKIAGTPAEQAAPQPDLVNEFLPPVYMRYEELKAKMTPEEAAEEAALEEAKSKMSYMERRRATGGFRRPFIRNRKEFQWVLEDNSRKLQYEGREEGRDSAKYVVLVPPGEDGEFFRVLPVEKWFKFNKPPAFTAMSTDEAENAMNEKGLAGFKRLQSIKKTLTDEKTLQDGDKKWSDSQRKASLLGEARPRTQGDAQPASSPGFKRSRPKLAKDGDMNIEDGDNSAVVAEAAGDVGNGEEDIFEKAIDRNMRGGQGGGDFEYEFDDDDDDGTAVALQALEEDAEQLEKGAEGFREANEEDVDGEGEEAENDLDAEELEGDESARLKELEELKQAADDDDDDDADQTLELYNKLYTKQFFNPKNKKKGANDADPNDKQAGGDNPTGTSDVKEQGDSSKSTNQSTTAAAAVPSATSSTQTSSNKRPLSGGATKPDPKKRKPDDVRKLMNEHVVNLLRRRGRTSTKAVIHHLRTIPPFDSMDGLVLVQLLQQASIEVADMTNDVVEGHVMVLKSQYM